MVHKDGTTCITLKPKSELQVLRKSAQLLYH